LIIMQRIFNGEHSNHDEMWWWWWFILILRFYVVPQSAT